MGTRPVADLPTEVMRDFRATTAAERRATGDRGVALVEFSFVMVLLGVLLFGIITFGYLMSYRQVMTQATAEGVRSAIAIEDDPATATVDERVQVALDSVNHLLASYHKSCGTNTTGVDTTGDGLSCVIVVHDCPDADTDTPMLSWSAPPAGGPDCITVDLTYDNQHHRLLPAVPLIDLAVPKTLHTRSTLQLKTVGS